MGTASNGGTAVRDDYAGGEVLADQSGANGVRTFTFTSAVQLVGVLSQGAGLVARCDPYGGTPSSTAGIPCVDGAAVHIPVNATVVKVYAPTGTTITVWGSRRA